MLPTEQRDELQQQATELFHQHQDHGIGGSVSLPKSDEVPYPGLKIVDGQIVSLPVDESTT